MDKEIQIGDYQEKNIELKRKVAILDQKKRRQISQTELYKKEI